MSLIYFPSCTQLPQKEERVKGGQIFSCYYALAQETLIYGELTDSRGLQGAHIS